MKDCNGCESKLICDICKKQICQKSDKDDCFKHGYYMTPEGNICRECYPRDNMKK